MTVCLRPFALLLQAHVVTQASRGCHGQGYTDEKREVFNRSRGTRATDLQRLGDSCRVLVKRQYKTTVRIIGHYSSDPHHFVLRGESWIPGRGELVHRRERLCYFAKRSRGKKPGVYLAKAKHIRWLDLDDEDRGPQTPSASITHLRRLGTRSQFVKMADEKGTAFGKKKYERLMEMLTFNIDDSVSDADGSETGNAC